MRRQTLLTILTVAMLVFAGCAGSTGGDGSPTPDGTTTPDGEADGTDDGTTATGTVKFYVSDEVGQIEDFKHLNVTISQIGFQRAGDSMDSDDEMETENETETATPTNGTDDTTTTESGVASDSQSDNHATEDESETPENETEAEEGDGEESDAGSGDGWITHDVDSRTVDLTRLKGDNATLIDSPELPAGNYTKVFVHVSDINATLKDATSVNVKLPSNKLQLNKGFTLEPNGTVSFVYDVTVFKAGNSGKYILKPVISQSGPDRPVESVDEDDESEDDSDEDGTEERGSPQEREQN